MPSGGVMGEPYHLRMAGPFLKGKGCEPNQDGYAENHRHPEGDMPTVSAAFARVGFRGGVEAG